MTTARHGGCPYQSVPATSRWADAVARTSAGSLNPHLPATLCIDPTTKIGTAGSCFAQHISRALVENGFHYEVVETAPPGLTQKELTAYNYEVFSARYGNIYTALQLVQLLQRAYGKFQPIDGVWRSPEGRWFDLFRPRIQPDGYASRRELLADQAQHFKAVRRLFETIDVFIFTLGLTETWRDRRDGSIYPICPGCGAGEYDPNRYEFHNFSVAEVSEHLELFLHALMEVNPKAQVILTVSPVPLIATFEPRHVLQSTVYSKAVLRVAAEEAIRRHSHVHYFASYEIITSSFQTERYFDTDRRTVTTAGVDHVMGVFLRQFTKAMETTGTSAGACATPYSERKSGSENHNPAMNVICDEADFFAAVAAKKTSGW
jgi:hypothetical protein